MLARMQEKMNPYPLLDLHFEIPQKAKDRPAI
jgi:hypothetical protein